jgi:membrane-associated phospholipid phosphatase
MLPQPDCAVESGLFMGEPDPKGAGRFSRHTDDLSSKPPAAVGEDCLALIRVLKQAGHRRRPCELEPHCWSSVLPPGRYSFPSGHSIAAFAVAVSIGMFYPSLTASLPSAAVLIAASRIILGMHFLGDVIVGSSIGIVLAFAAFHIFCLL